MFILKNLNVGDKDYLQYRCQRSYNKRSQCVFLQSIVLSLRFKSEHCENDQPQEQHQGKNYRQYCVRVHFWNPIINLLLFFIFNTCIKIKKMDFYLFFKNKILFNYWSPAKRAFFQRNNTFSVKSMFAVQFSQFCKAI